MKTPFVLLLGLALCLLPAATAQTVDEPPPPARLDRAAVEKLVGPIALYPDPLVALVLPAATRPSDIVLAARYLERGGDPVATDAQTWEPSVKALVHYREVVTLLDENLAWTQQLGDCFLVQPDDVMGAIQTLRRRAFDAGLLADTAEHEVVVENGEIRIVPARATVIHVPRYDPDVLTVEQVVHASHRARSYVSFSVGYGVGSWLCYEPDWGYSSVRIVHRPAFWYQQPGWRWRHAHRYEPHSGYRWTRWTPPPRPPRHAHSPRRDRNPDWSRPGRPDAHAPRVDDHDRRPRHGDRDRGRDGDRRRRDRPTREPLRPGEVAPLTADIAPVVPDLTPVVPVTTTVDPLAPPPSTRPSARFNGEERRRDRGERGERFGPPRERTGERDRSPSTRPDHSAANTTTATSTPAFTPPPRTTPARPDGPAPRRERTERRERADRFARAEDSPGRQNEPR